VAVADEWLGTDRAGPTFDERTPLVELLFGFVAGISAVGVLVVASGWTEGRPKDPDESIPEGLMSRVAITIVAATAVLAVTGWVVALVAGAIGGWVGVGAWRNRGRGGKREQERVEALAEWCEQLRDLLSAEHGIVGTIESTQATCPAPICDEVMALAARLARQSPGAAVRQFADDLDDPSGDLVASVLLMAMSRSARTAELLSELAVTIRDRAAMRLRVEAERSGQRSEARFIIGFTAAVVTGVLIFGRGSEFLAAYDDLAGQAMLALIFGMFGVGGWYIVRLTRFERPSRFLTIDEEL
jgi:tight adherence protein B